MTTIVIGHPPIIDRLIAAVPAARSPTVIFSYGDLIFNPSGQNIPAAIMAHEEVHCRRQLDIGTSRWWDQWLDDIAFRVAEELLGHQAEYRVRCEEVPNRNGRRYWAKEIAKRLSGPLYGHSITYAKALGAIRESA